MIYDHKCYLPLIACIGVRRILQWRGFTWWVRARRSDGRNGSPQVGSRGKGPVGGLRDKVTQKLKQNESSVQFLSFS